jgi:hypothetical protein
MDWAETLKNLKKMEGMRLKSISGKSDIKVVSVADDYVTIETKTKKTKRRKISEIKGIAEHMTKGKVLHVDAELQGSGSSRNQPETLIANMPDVEFVMKDKKKHVVWTGENTHKLGTLKERG